MEKLKEYIKRDAAYKHAMTMLSWDLETQAPKQAISGLSRTMETLSELQYTNYVNDDFKEKLYSIDEEALNDTDRRIVKKLKKEIFEKMSKIPKDEYTAYQALVTKSCHAWEIAKNESDYSKFKDYLKELIKANKKFISYIGYKGHPYNVLLDDFEEGITVDVLDEFFGLLKTELSPFILEVQKVKEKKLKDIKDKFYNIKFSVEEQKEISKELSTIMGFDFSKGVIAESEHPFTTNMNNKDVRFTTHYYLDDVLSGIYSTVHETGHGIYEQQISDEFDESIVLAGGATMGIHEAQSRFYENVIGKMKEFTDMIYDVLEKYKKINISKDEFYIVVNEVKSQFIRTDADELTYPIHVLIRYEIEKKMFENLDEEVDMDELKTLWNDMYEKYLGIRPSDDKEGILQDSHWSAGLFGYFPSYAIGSAFASQMYSALEKVVDVNKAIENKEFYKINDFLKETIHKYGSSRSPKELIMSCSNENLNPNYYINYLKEKFSKIYL